MRPWSRAGAVATFVALALALALVACGGSGPGPAADPEGGPSGSILVAAASSLTDAFEQIADEVEARHPGIDVELTFDASSSLAAQIELGAPIDVMASADEASIERVREAGRAAGPPRIFARNALTIATKPGNPERVSSLADLDDVGIVALCASEVPCGRYAERVLAAAGVELRSDRVTRGESARTTLGAVAHGDADAGIVYVTDVQAAASAVNGVEIPPAQNAVADYPIVVLRGRGDTTAAKAFVRYVTSPAGRRTLASFGFTAP